MPPFWNQCTKQSQMVWVPPTTVPVARSGSWCVKQGVVWSGSQWMHARPAAAWVGWRSACRNSRKCCVWMEQSDPSNRMLLPALIRNGNQWRWTGVECGKAPEERCLWAKGKTQGVLEKQTGKEKGWAAEWGAETTDTERDGSEGWENELVRGQCYFVWPRSYPFCMTDCVGWGRGGKEGVGIGTGGRSGSC